MKMFSQFKLKARFWKSNNNTVDLGEKKESNNGNNHTKNTNRLFETCISLASSDSANYDKPYNDQVMFTPYELSTLT